MSGPHSRALLFLSPAVLVVSILFVTPLAVMTGASFISVDGNQTRLSLDPYARFFSDSYYLGSLALTFATAVLVAILSVVLAYPVAYLYWQSSRRARSVMLVLLLSPFYANIVVKVFGWLVLLAPGGLVNGVLLSTGAITDPIDFLNGYFAIVLISVHRCLPFVVLLLASAMAGIDEEVLQSARLCGAGGVRVFRSVVVPLSMPGVLASAIVAFSLTAAGFVIPRLVGGSTGNRFTPVLLYQQIVVTQNWRFGPAIGVVILFASVVTVAAGTRLAARAKAGRVLGDAFIQ